MLLRDIRIMKIYCAIDCKIENTEAIIEKRILTFLNGFALELNSLCLSRRLF